MTKPDTKKLNEILETMTDEERRQLAKQSRAKEMRDYHARRALRERLRTEGIAQA